MNLYFVLLGHEIGIPERRKGFRPLPHDIQEAINRLHSLFAKKRVLLAYLFGSLNGSGEGQDVDLAILVREGQAFRLRESVTEYLGTERVVLVGLQCASPVVRFEILRTGGPIWVSDERMQEEFELETLGLYRDTAPLRCQQKAYMRKRIGHMILRPQDFEKQLKGLDELEGSKQKQGPLSGGEGIFSSL